MEIIKRQDALEAGLLLYFTGKPCKYGHIDQRYSSSGLCLSCMPRKNAERAAYKKQYKKDRAEHFRKISKAYRETRRDIQKAYMAEYYQKHKERWYEWGKKQRENNRERDRAYKKKWRDNNKAYGASRAALYNARKGQATCRVTVADFAQSIKSGKGHKRDRLCIT